MIKLFSVDDDNAFLDVIDKSFSFNKGEFEMVGRYGEVGTDDGVEYLIETIDATKPDVVLMDFDFSRVGTPPRPDDFGIELTKLICSKIPNQIVIMLTWDHPLSNDEVLQRVKRSFNAGAIAYLRKGETSNWFECIRETVKSQIPTRQIPDSILNMVTERLKRGGKSKLNDREIAAINHLSEGKKVREIAEAMKLTFDSINYHLDNAKIKLEVDTLQGLVGKAFREGYLF